jgi:uncharacterized protein (TIGR02453 family)
MCDELTAGLSGLFAEFAYLQRIEMNNTSTSLTFSEDSLKFLTLAGKQDDADWLEHHDGEYQRLIRSPLLALAETLKQALAIEAQGYHFPTRGIGRIKKPSNKVTLDGAQFKDWVSYIATRPARSRFEKNPLLFFGLLPNDPQWKGVVVAGGLYMASSLQTRRVRQVIADNSEPFKSLFTDKNFRNSFKSGFEPLVKAQKCPRGFDPDHPDIEWIKLKTFFVCKTLTMKEFGSQDLTGNLVRDFRQLLRLNELLQNTIDGVGS